jgi:hypothetical protein
MHAVAAAYKMLCIIEDDTGLNPDANTLSRGKHFPHEIQNSAANLSCKAAKMLWQRQSKMQRECALRRGA